MKEKMLKRGATCSPTGSARASMTSVNSRAEFAAGHKAGGASRAQRPDRAPKQKSKLIKIFAASGLALIMGAGVLCGTIIPINSGGSATASMTGQNPQSGQQAFHNASGAATQENLVAGEAIQLNPQTDETIFTTESGFEIKSHTVAGQTVANSQVQYFTLGSYNGTPVNWIILAGSTQMTDSTPAGTAINSDTSKQLYSFMASGNLSTNQMLVISQYAFNQAGIAASVSAHSAVTISFSSSFYGVKHFPTTTDQITDFYASAPVFETTVASNCLNLGTTLGLNSYYGSKIVKNTNFNSNYVFNLSTSQVNTYIGSISCKIPYLFTATSTATNCLTSDSLTHSVTSTFTYVDTASDPSDSWNNFYHVSGSGAANAKYSYINSSGNVTSTTFIQYTASYADTGAYYKPSSSNTRYFNFKTTYSVSATTLTAAYRPAMVIDLSKF